jgi:hypothetical protein
MSAASSSLRPHSVQQHRAEGATQIVQVHGMRNAFVIDVDDAGGVAQSAEADAQAVPGPGLAVGVDQHRLDVRPALARAEFGEQRFELGRLRNDGALPLAPARLERPLDDRELADLRF